MSKQPKQVSFADELLNLPSPQVDPDLLCPNCKKRFNSPLLLPCLHSVCKSCLQDDRVLKNGKIPRCPTCCETLDLRNDFPVNFVLNNMVNKAAMQGTSSRFLIRCDSCDSHEEKVTMRCNDCFLFLCNFCATAHRRMSATRAHNIASLQELRNKSLTTSLSRPCFCVVHSKHQIMSFCQSCKVAICRECVASQHRNHELLTPDQAYKQLKSHMINMTDKVQRKQKQMQKSVSSLQNAISKIEKHSSQVRCAIEEYFGNLLKAVRQRMKTLLSELKDTTDTKLNKLQNQKFKLELALKGAQNCCSLTEKAVLRGSEVELISVCHTIIQRLTQHHQDDVVLPCVTDGDAHKNVTFTADGEDLLDTINITGYLDISLPTDPSLSTMAVNTLQVKVEEVSRFSVTAVNLRGLRQAKGGDAITIQLYILGTQINADTVGFKYSIHDSSDGQYTIAFVINKPELYAMHVDLNGQQVQGNPLMVTVTPTDWIDSGFIIRGEQCGGFSSPHSVLVDNSNNVVVADSHNHEIKTIDVAGKLMRSIGSQGMRDGQFNFPYCIALNPHNTLLVISDSHNNRIQVIDNVSGKFRKSFGTYGTEAGMLNHPHGIAIDSKDSIYVADSGNSRVQIFSTEGRLLGKLESEHLSRPWGVSLTRDGRTAVTDYNHHRVLVFNQDGTLRFYFGSRGSDDGQLNNPAGIVVNADDQFIVADRSNHRVQIFQADGTFVTKFGGKGSGNGLMKFPAGVAVDKSGHLYVADTLNNRIQVFSLTAV